MRKRTLTRLAVAGVLIVVSIFFARWLNIKLYEQGNLWDVALFQLDEEEDILNYDYSCPDFVFSPRQFIRTEYHYCSGYADPFLIVKDDYLYLFYEYEICDGNAMINAMRTSDFKEWEDLGTVLQEPFHLSYPNVFENDGHIYMVPETNMNKAVTVYEARNFPYDWTPVKDLLKGHQYVDNTFVEKDGITYLFTLFGDSDSLSKPGFHLYESDSLLGDYEEHPQSPINNDPLNNRCGGAIFEYNGKLIRPAQKNDVGYGDDLAFYEITELDKENYSERFIKYVHADKSDWDMYGGHHFKSVLFKGKRIVVMDGLIKDSWINNRTRKLFDRLSKEQ